MQMQKLQQSIQEMQGQIQMMQMQKQLQDMMQTQQAPPGGLAGTDTTGAPQFPPQSPQGGVPGGPAPGGAPIPIVPGGAGGSPPFGQSPGMPGVTQAGPIVNPQTALSQQARQQSAIRQITGFGAEAEAYGTPSAGDVV